ncbi:MAG: GH25 family lysozyme [Eubacteriales bacterium]|nr:GH25 family lysozyme [Eubacteriales bacterium]MDD4474692.1 GH25 family lysozyme [Eubacteriales bacterium]
MLRKRILITSIIIFLCSAVIISLYFTGVLKFNNPSKTKYPIRGVDVSSYQGVIDWDVLSAEGIDFAFIKATEGSDFVDPRFSYNYENAVGTNLRIGAYHFFSFDSSGETQADNFINNVYQIEKMLPPVVDVEFYGKYLSSPPTDVETIKTELRMMLERLEENYRITPIIYATEESYVLFLKNDFMEYPIWIRNVITKPSLSDGREWTFWQYTNRETLKGYKGTEKYIDMNVFNGTAEEFENLFGKK